ncbi:hypothetical protein LINGRAHAP2_LOCUS32472 [Linum grandiflorum]
MLGSSAIHPNLISSLLSEHFGLTPM